MGRLRGLRTQGDCCSTKLAGLGTPLPPAQIKCYCATTLNFLLTFHIGVSTVYNSRTDKQKLGQLQRRWNWEGNRGPTESGATFLLGFIAHRPTHVCHRIVTQRVRPSIVTMHSPARLSLALLLLYTDYCISRLPCSEKVDSDEHACFAHWSTTSQPRTKLSVAACLRQTQMASTRGNGCAFGSWKSVHTT